MPSNTPPLGEAEAALRAFASAGADERSRLRYARSLRPPALAALLRHLRVSGPSSATESLRLLWASSLPRSELIGALLAAPSALALASELDVLARAAKHLRALTACAAAAARNGSPAAARVLLACARAAQRRPEPRASHAAARIVTTAVHLLVTRAAAPADGVLALADAGFASQAAAPAVHRAREFAGFADPAPPLFHALLLLLPRVPAGSTRDDVAAAAAQLAEPARGAAARACLLAVQSAAAEGAPVADALLSLYERSLARALANSPDGDPGDARANAGPVREIGAMDVAFIYALLAHASVKQRCLALLHALCSAPGTLFAPGLPAAGSSSAAASEPRAERGRSRALLGALSVPGIAEHNLLIADVCDSLACASSREARTWASRMLSTLFREHAGARARVLDNLFSSLLHPAGHDAPLTYLTLLDELSQLADAAPLLRAHVPVLAHWLGFLAAMPFDAAVAVIVALARIAATLPALCDRLLVHLRKLTAARARVSRCLALHGLVALASANAAPHSLFEEAAALLVAALSRARDTRVPALKLLADAARDATPPGRARRWAPLHGAVLARLAALAGARDDARTSSTSPSALRLGDCFAPCCGGVAALREAPLLLAYALAVRGEVASADALCSGTEAHIADARGALWDACAPPPGAPPVAAAKWVCARVAMLAALCEDFLIADRAPVPRVLHVYALAFVVRNTAPPTSRARPAHDRACPAATGADATGAAVALGTVSARERCAHESLAASKRFAALEAAGAVSGACALALPDCLRVLSCIRGVEDAVGRYAASVLRAEVLVRVLEVFSGRDDPHAEEFRVDVMGVAKSAFVATNPERGEGLPPKIPENSRGKMGQKHEAELVKKGTRKAVRRASRLSGEGPRSTRKRARVSVPPQEVNAWSRKQRMQRGIPVPVEPKVPESPGRSSSTSSMLGSAVEDAASEASVEIDIVGEVEMALQKMQYDPAREALARALEKRDAICDGARLSARSSAVKLLLRSMSLHFQAREWGFLVENRSRDVTAIECARELVSLFELDFKRSMSNTLALDYLELLCWFINSSKTASEADAAGIRGFLAETATRLLKEYSISQIRIVRSLFSLLLSSLEDDVALAVVQKVFEWLGNQQGVLDSSYKSDGGRVIFSEGTFDHDILEEAYELDGVVPDSESSKLEKRASYEEASSAAEEGNPSKTTAISSKKRRRTSARTAVVQAASSQPSEDENLAPISLLPNGVKVTELGLNDTEESCLLCVQAALQRLDDALPTSETLRGMHALERDELLCELARLSRCTGAFRALLATQKQPAGGRRRITWTRTLGRRAAETLCRVLGAASAALEGVRREMPNAECEFGADLFEAVFSACAAVLRATLGEDGAARTARALCAGDGMACARARRAAARLELDAAAAVAELERHCDSDGALEDLKSAYREIVGCSAAEGAQDAPAVAVRARKKRRVRSRNKVVDDWLEDEDGEDDFADLEDFLVGRDESEL